MQLIQAQLSRVSSSLAHSLTHPLLFLYRARALTRSLSHSLSRAVSVYLLFFYFYVTQELIAPFERIEEEIIHIGFTIQAENLSKPVIVLGSESKT